MQATCCVKWLTILTVCYVAVNICLNTLDNAAQGSSIWTSDAALRDVGREVFVRDPVLASDDVTSQLPGLDEALDRLGVDVEPATDLSGRMELACRLGGALHVHAPCPA